MRQRIVLLPTYNEAPNLVGLVEAILRASDAAVLVIDDHSPDGTGALAEALHAAHPTRVWVRHRPAKEGLGRAYADGAGRPQLRYAAAGVPWSLGRDTRGAPLDRHAASSSHAAAQDDRA